MLFVLILLVMVMLAVTLVMIYLKVTTTQRAIQEAIEAGPEGTARALCQIFETFDQLSTYHGFPPATDDATREACAALADA